MQKTHVIQNKSLDVKKAIARDEMKRFHDQKDSNFGNSRNNFNFNGNQQRGGPGGKSYGAGGNNYAANTNNFPNYNQRSNSTNAWDSANNPPIGGYANNWNYSNGNANATPWTANVATDVSSYTNGNNYNSFQNTNAMQQPPQQLNDFGTSYQQTYNNGPIRKTNNYTQPRNGPYGGSNQNTVGYNTSK